MSDPIKPNFLTRTLYTSSSIYEALQALAEVEQAESPDHLATAMLNDLLQKKHGLLKLVQRRRSDTADRVKWYREELSKQSQPQPLDDEPLP